MQGEVLVVDDDVAFANGLASILQSHGYTAKVAYDGHEALQQLAAHAFDVVLSDIVMPGMIGCTLVQAAHALPGRDDVPFVFMSVLNEAKVQSFFDTSIRYVQKPFDSHQLLAVLSEAVSNEPPVDQRRSVGGDPAPGTPQRRGR
ncbi:MAG: response regulator [Pseudomonadota bacterium]|nr:response regulator [Pseudomonadota bacterium]